MKPKQAWSLIIILCLVSLAFIFASAVVHAEPPSLASRIEAVAPAFANRKGPPVDFHELGQAIAEVAKGDRQGAALLLTIAIHESGLRESVRLDQYTDQQGDAYRDRDGEIKHRASGLWQVHANAHNSAEWGSPDLKLQARSAARLAAGALARCRKRAPYPINVFRAYAGRACDMPLKGEEQRVATYQRIVGRL